MESNLFFQIIMHPQYDSSLVHNDIALIEIANPITFKSDNKVAPACLPPPEAEYYPGTMVTVTGWGTLSSGKLRNSNFI